jgi:hypothetical protein
MNCLLVVVVAVVLSTSAGAFHLGPAMPQKSPRPWPVNVPGDLRQGGDTVADALPVATLPFTDIGTTTGYVDDYDEVCPYADSTAPDVVYSLAFDREYILDIDMAGSSYDTKIYLYDQSFQLVACNDDFYPDYTSRIDDAEVMAGITYYLVIDGYGAEHGEYALDISFFTPPPPPPPVLAGCDAIIEDEPPLVDGYVDMHNGGCSSEEFGAPMSDIGGAFQFGPSEFAGTSGWYNVAGESRRDTDWLQGYLDQWGTCGLEILSEQTVSLFQLAPLDCGSVEILNSVLVEPGVRTVFIVEGAPYEDVWLCVVPATFEPPADFTGSEFSYRLDFGSELARSCLTPTPGNDRGFGGVEVVLDEYDLRFRTGDFTDALDGQFLCGLPFALPGGDIAIPVYFNSDFGRVHFTWDPQILATRSEARGYTCLALFSDLRPLVGSCVDEVCFNESPWGGTVIGAGEGWHWLVVDREGLNDVSRWAWLDFYDVGTSEIPPLNDRCAGAVTLYPGPFVIEGDATHATNRFDPGPDGCPGHPEVQFTSRDVVYQVSLAAGQRLDVTMTGIDPAVADLYLVRDCQEPVGNCVAAGERVDGGIRLQHVALEDEYLWLVCDTYDLGSRAFTLTGSIDSTTGASVVNMAGLALRTAPNPFNPVTTMAFDLPRRGHVTLRVYDLGGRLVATLVNEVREAGRHEVTWRGLDARGRGQASATYVARLEAGGEERTVRLTLLK